MAKEQKSVVIVKKVVKGHGGHHGGAWKVAYADFVTAMMAFFMVMWIIGMDQATKSAIQGYFQNPVGFSESASTSMRPVNLGSPPKPATEITPVSVMARQREEQRFQEMAKGIESELQKADGLGALAAQVEVVVTDEGLRIELVEGGDGEMFFAFGRSELKPAAARALAIITSELSSSSAPVVLEGHTDAARYRNSSGLTNWDLSADRANAARRAMESNGLESSRVVEVRGYADRHLRVAANPLDNSNRRISVLLPFTVPATPDLPVEVPIETQAGHS